MLVNAVRFGMTPYGVFGTWILPSETVLFSCEDQWRQNLNNVSCIKPAPNAPAILYNIKRDRTGRHKFYKFLDVDGRELVEVHSGNIEDDTEGCPLLGTHLGFVNNKWAVTNSKTALEILVNELGEGDHQVLISWSFDKTWN